MGQRNIEPAVAGDFLARLRKHRRAERQAGPPKRRDVVQIGKIKLHFTIEDRDGPVDEIAIRRTKSRQRSEQVRVQLTDEFQNLRLDMVHIVTDGEPDLVILDRSLFEFLKGQFDIGAIIALPLVFLNRKSVIGYEHAVFDRSQFGLEFLRLDMQGRKGLGLDVAYDVGAKCEEPA